MAAYDPSRATDFREIDRWDGGVGWMVHPTELGERASHAILADGGLWVIDPLDAPGIDDLFDEFGDVVGVVVLSSHHARDATDIANRHGVPIHIPKWLRRVEDRVDGTVKRDSAVLSTAGFDSVRVEPFSMYQEAIVYHDRDGTLIVPDLLSTAPGYPVGDERIGLMIAARLVPPRDLFAGMEPERILFGHGQGVFNGATAALQYALTNARKRFPEALLKTFTTNLRLFYSAQFG